MVFTEAGPAASNKCGDVSVVQIYINKHRLQAAAQPVTLSTNDLPASPSCLPLFEQICISAPSKHLGRLTGRSGQACTEPSKQFNDCLASNSFGSAWLLRLHSSILDVLLSCPKTHCRQCLRSAHGVNGRRHHVRGSQPAGVRGAHPAAGRAAGPAGRREDQEARRRFDGKSQRAVSAQSWWVASSLSCCALLT